MVLSQPKVLKYYIYFIEGTLEVLFKACCAMDLKDQ